MNTDATLGEAKIQGKGRSLCELHPDVDYRVAWGCPECVMELLEERDALTQENQRLRDAIEPLLAEVKNLRDTLSASSLEPDLQVADGWHALIKAVEAALEGKEGNPSPPSTINQRPSTNPNTPRPGGG